MGEPAPLLRALAGTARDGSHSGNVAWLRGRLGAGDEAIETHFAWVFLVGDRAWKLRKPTRFTHNDHPGFNSILMWHCA